MLTFLYPYISLYILEYLTFSNERLILLIYLILIHEII